ncbi:MAG: carbamoyltransferase HypF [Deinococcales bacterium]
MADAVADGERALIRVHGVVQGVGFRPFVYRLALRHQLAGWVLNDAQGVLIEAVGSPSALTSFLVALSAEAPAAARVDEVIALTREPARAPGAPFEIRGSAREGAITTLISPDLAVCEDCLEELFDPADPRYRYPYINCTHCGPRYSIIEALPYDRPRTTMKHFPLCERCHAEYVDPSNRRFHAQPVACPECGPAYHLLDAGGREVATDDPIASAAERLAAGAIVAVKGIGGYHLACDARDPAAVAALRERKVRKEKPFALMARDLSTARQVADVSGAEETLLTSPARPIVLLAKGRAELPADLAPDNADLGVMLPYAPLHHLLFAAGAPALLVMTSANRSSEPIAYRDVAALHDLSGLADAFLVGDRPIARRIDDSVAAVLDGSPSVLRRARGYAPAPVVSDPRFGEGAPILALGAGLKNAITLGVAGHAFVSQHLGDLDHVEAALAFEETVRDLSAMYRVEPARARVIHDLHPDYGSSRLARALGAPTLAVQHHRAHIASVLAERRAWDTRVVGLAFDGAGLGEDGTVWGGEAFTGSLDEGLARAAYLRPAPLPGGDAAARHPEQAAVGFLWEQPPSLPWRELLGERTVRVAGRLIETGLRTPQTSSIGRLFDTAAALLGFRRPMSFEGQAAAFLESLARRSGAARTEAEAGYPFPFEDGQWDHRPLLAALAGDVRRGVTAEACALRFHVALATGAVAAAEVLAAAHDAGTVALSGGVWQNRLLHGLTVRGLRATGLEPWWNERVPPGDGGVSLGQAALAASRRADAPAEGDGHVSRHPL